MHKRSGLYDKKCDVSRKWGYIVRSEFELMLAIESELTINRDIQLTWPYTGSQITCQFSS